MSYFVGIDIGGTNIEIGILNKDGKIFSRKSIKTESKNGARKTFERIFDKIKESLNDLNLTLDDIERIGLGIPGPVVNNSTVKIAANFSWGNDFNAKELLELISGKEVRVINDVKGIALGESIFGAGRGYKNSVTIAIGTGIAAGIITDGQIIEGFNGAAGEFGHIIIEEDGYQCGCGLTGCLETHCSANGLVREGKKRLNRVEKKEENRLYQKINGDLDRLEAKDIFDLAKEGDKFSKDIVDTFCKYLAKGIGILLNLLNPELIIFSGGVSKAGDIIVDGIKKYLPKYALSISLEGLNFKFSELKEDAGVLGALAVAIK